jgi:hypothetical protein
MVRVQRVEFDGQDPTWTVLGRDHLPLAEAEQFLEYLRQTRPSCASSTGTASNRPGSGSASCGA